MTLPLSFKVFSQTEQVFIFSTARPGTSPRIKLTEYLQFFLPPITAALHLERIGSSFMSVPAAALYLHYSQKSHSCFRIGSTCCHCCPPGSTSQRWQAAGCRGLCCGG